MQSSPLQCRGCLFVSNYLQVCDTCLAPACSTCISITLHVLLHHMHICVVCLLAMSQAQAVSLRHPPLTVGLGLVAFLGTVGSATIIFNESDKMFSDPM